MDIKISERFDLEFDPTFLEERCSIRTMNIPQIPSMSGLISHPASRKCDVLWQITAVDKLAGFAGICDIDSKNSHCQILFAFLDDLQACKETILKLTDLVFGNLGLRKTHCLVPDGNQALKILENLGFIAEATMRRHCIIHGEYTDVKWLGLLRSESGRYTD
ncbi:MAG: GNAT family N-acetyltransferase [Caldisericia bacterium]|nr:GNAT family N-acetyltransferase [Caldisericia bacterium]